MVGRLPGPRARRTLLLGLLLAASACAPAPPAAVGPSAAPSKRPGGPGGRPGASTSPTASAAPATGSPGPAGSPGAGSPPASAGPSAAGGSPAATPDPRLARIEAALLRVAAIDFGQNRGRLAAGGAFDGPDGAKLIGDQGAGIISNNGSGIVSDHGGGIVSDHGGGIISNNGGSILSNNGGSILSNNGGSYRLAQAASPPPRPKVTIDAEAKAGETLFADRLYADGVRFRSFKVQVASGLETTRMVAIRDGAPFYERRREITAMHADGKQPSSYKEATAEILAGGRFAYRQETVTDLDAAGKTVKSTIQPGSFVVDEATGGVTLIEKYFYETAGRTGGFTYVYGNLALAERGTLVDVKVDANGGAAYAFWDPLEVDDGDSEVVNAKGEVLLTKRQRTEGGVTRREYGFGEGLTMALVRKTRDRLEGRLREGPAETADVVQEVRADGSTVFTVTFDAAKDRPLTIGYGLAKEGAPAAARPTQPPRFNVVTVAGAVEAGHVNGAAGTARFKQPIGLAPARATASKVFVADTANHRVRVLLANGALEVADLAGGDVAGWVDGPAADARFKAPYALAVAADDIVYVADIEDHRIRVIAPDGTVSTLAGTGSPGFADGPPGVGTLAYPSGLALDGQGRLWVAEHGNHAIRRIETQGVDKGRITTIAGGVPGGGTGGAGFADGAGGKDGPARFNSPRGLAFGPEGALFVADFENHRIRRVGTDGAVSTYVGSDDKTRVFIDGPATRTYLNPPRGVAFGPDGTLYFTTPFDVFHVPPGGAEVRSYAGGAVRGQRDGVAAFASFADAQGLFYSATGVLYVLDENKVRAVRPPSSPKP